MKLIMISLIWNALMFTNIWRVFTERHGSAWGKHGHSPLLHVCSHSLELVHGVHEDTFRRKGLALDKNCLHCKSASALWIWELSQATEVQLQLNDIKKVEKSLCNLIWKFWLNLLWIKPFVELVFPACSDSFSIVSFGRNEWSKILTINYGSLGHNEDFLCRWFHHNIFLL